jgi:uncharacterized membrane protein YoaK (UPF0700 family)
MAFQAGFLNTGGFMACHRFVSHVTGFATFFGIEASHGNFNGALGMLAVPVFFLVGSMIAGELIDIRIKLHKKPKYFLTFGLMFFLILFVLVSGIAGMFGDFGQPLDIKGDYILLAVLCMVCGIQNATITTVSKSIVRTTHLTGITTDLGIGLIRVLHRQKFNFTMDDEAKANLMRFGIITSFGLGSVIGALTFLKYGYYGFSIPVATSGILFATMVYFQLVKRHHRSSPKSDQSHSGPKS